MQYFNVRQYSTLNHLSPGKFLTRFSITSLLPIKSKKVANYYDDAHQAALQRMDMNGKDNRVATSEHNSILPKLLPVQPIYSQTENERTFRDQCNGPSIENSSSDGESFKNPKRTSTAIKNNGPSTTSTRILFKDRGHRRRICPGSESQGPIRPTHTASCRYHKRWACFCPLPASGGQQP